MNLNKVGIKNYPEVKCIEFPIANFTNTGVIVNFRLKRRLLEFFFLEIFCSVSYRMK